MLGDIGWETRSQMMDKNVELEMKVGQLTTGKLIPPTSSLWTRSEYIDMIMLGGKID